MCANSGILASENYIFVVTMPLSFVFIVFIILTQYTFLTIVLAFIPFFGTPD